MKKNNLKVMLILLGLLAALSVSLRLVKQRQELRKGAAFDTVGIKFLPETKLVFDKVGEEKTLSVYVNPVNNGRKISSFEFTICYPDSLIEIVSTDAKMADKVKLWQYDAAAGMEMQTIKTYTGITGLKCLNFSGVEKQPSVYLPPKDNETAFKLMDITFKSINKGTGKVEIDNTLGSDGVPRTMFYATNPNCTAATCDKTISISDPRVVELVEVAQNITCDGFPLNTGKCKDVTTILTCTDVNGVGTWGSDRTCGDDKKCSTKADGTGECILKDVVQCTGVDFTGTTKNWGVGQTGCQTKLVAAKCINSNGVGAWTDIINCTDVKECDNGACVAKFCKKPITLERKEFGSKICSTDGNGLLECNRNGGWTASDVCVGGCENGVCLDLKKCTDKLTNTKLWNPGEYGCYSKDTKAKCLASGQFDPDTIVECKDCNLGVCSDQTTCSDGTAVNAWTCVGTTSRKQCLPTKLFGATESCGTGNVCSAGNCVPSETTCSDGTAVNAWTCVGTTSRKQCLPTKLFGATESCGTGNKCVGGNCVPDVVDCNGTAVNAWACKDTATKYQCLATGSFGNETACVTGKKCSGGSCVDDVVSKWYRTTGICDVNTGKYSCVYDANYGTKVTYENETICTTDINCSNKPWVIDRNQGVNGCDRSMPKYYCTKNLTGLGGKATEGECIIADSNCTKDTAETQKVTLKLTFTNVRDIQSDCAVDWPTKVTIQQGNGTTLAFAATKIESTSQNVVVKGQALRVYSLSLNVPKSYVGNNYMLFVKGSKHLMTKYGLNNQKEYYNKSGGEISLTGADATLDFTGYPLLAGDVISSVDLNQDGRLDAYDFSYIKKYADLRTPVGTGTNFIADLNGDCTMNAVDTATLLKSLNEKLDQLY